MQSIKERKRKFVSKVRDLTFYPNFIYEVNMLYFQKVYCLVYIISKIKNRVNLSGIKSRFVEMFKGFIEIDYVIIRKILDSGDPIPVSLICV